ncbi:C-type mannose receptor 2-like [Nothobranchius furzeri]|uniref:C-type mannose receptor 2-like n=2 Tax=Nothobranchius furzeri TaxID=105023 RepID=A0A9D3BKE1_NOTFU|nr:C-type mannose receptor 2-like [Nothobranchius furzeri]
MEKIVFRVIIVAGACCLSAKHVFIQNDLSWAEARAYCQNFHVDLSCLTSESEEKLFRLSVDESKRGWIGAYWDANFQMWKWSDGENVTYDNNLDLSYSGGTSPPHLKDNVRWKNDGWEWDDGGHKNDFFCFNLTLVQEEKTWEEALEHCSEKHSNFTSLLSETENILATKEISQTSVTERVWIGLRYLEDSWLWVNGDPLMYQAWSQGGDQLCPMMRRCGALTKDGAWESRDCLEKLHFICA